MRTPIGRATGCGTPRSARARSATCGGVGDDQRRGASDAAVHGERKRHVGSRTGTEELREARGTADAFLGERELPTAEPPVNASGTENASPLRRMPHARTKGGRQACRPKAREGFVGPPVSYDCDKRRSQGWFRGSLWSIESVVGHVVRPEFGLYVAHDSGFGWRCTWGLLYV